MAKNHVWHQFQNADLQITDSSSSWTIASDCTVQAQLIQGPGFFNDKITIDGVIYHQDGDAISLQGTGNDVTFGSGSLIEGDTAILTTGTKNSVTNNGHLLVNSDAMDIRGDKSTVANGATGRISGDSGIITIGVGIHVVNDGKILVEHDALSLRGAGSTFVNNGLMGSDVGGAINCGDVKSIVNGKHGEIYGSTGCLLMATHAGSHVTIENHGIMKAGNLRAIVSGDGNETLINDGRIIGDLEMGGGNDVIDLRGGHVTGPIMGGAGNDTLITDNANISFTAMGPPVAGEIDTIKSTVTYTLINAVNDLVLIGKKSINATGNEIDNHLAGNVGSNVLKGMDGADALDGGKGNDRLFGGAGADTFGFATGYGRDEIKDFHQGEGDNIYIHNWKAISDFQDLKHNASDHGAAVWITAGHDTLIIDHMHKIDLQAADFGF